MSSKREVLQLLRRCLSEDATQETMDECKESLALSDPDATVEALLEILENRRAQPSSLASSGLVRKSAAGSGGAGLLFRRSTRQVSQDGGSATSAGGGGGSSPGAPPPSSAAAGDNGPLAGDEEPPADSTPLRASQISLLTMVLLPLTKVDTLRVAITKNLLVVIADRNTSTKFLRANAACLFGSLFAAKFVFGDPYECLFELFSRIEGGVATLDQCTAISTILRAAVSAVKGSAAQYQQLLASPFRQRLQDLVLQSDVTKNATDGTIPDSSRERLEELRRSNSNAAGDLRKSGSAQFGAASPGVGGDPLKSVLCDLRQPLSLSQQQNPANNSVAVPQSGASAATLLLTRENPVVDDGKGSAAAGDGGLNCSSSGLNGSRSGRAPPPSPLCVGEDDHHDPLRTTEGNSLAPGSAGEGSGASSSVAPGGSGSAVPQGPPPAYTATGFVPRLPPPCYSDLRSTGGGSSLSSSQAAQPPPPLALVGDTHSLSGVPLGQHISHRLSASQKEDAKLRTVYINKLDPHITEGQLRDFLDRCGQVIRVRLCGELVGRTKYGFVEYSTSEAASALLKRDREVLGSCTVRCSIAKQSIQDVDPQMDAIFDAKRGMTRACLFGFISRSKMSSAASAATTATNSSGGSSTMSQSSAPPQQ